MRTFFITYRYTNPRAAIGYVIATVRFTCEYLSAYQVAQTFESADPRFRVLGIKVAA